jgi:hypothetical protein
VGERQSASGIEAEWRGRERRDGPNAEVQCAKLGRRRQSAYAGALISANSLVCLMGLISISFGTYSEMTDAAARLV